jgi:hypothetical protein
MPCYGLSVFPMYHLNGGTVCCVQSLGTIMNDGGDVQANLLIAVQHSRLVLGIQVPGSMLSTRLAVVELAMPRTTYFLHLVLPSVPKL